MKPFAAACVSISTRPPASVEETWPSKGERNVDCSSRKSLAGSPSARPGGTGPAGAVTSSAREGPRELPQPKPCPTAGPAPGGRGGGRRRGGRGTKRSTAAASSGRVVDDERAERRAVPRSD